MAAYLIYGLVCTIALSVLAYAMGWGLRSTRTTSSPFFLTCALCFAMGLSWILTGGIHWIDLLPLPKHEPLE